MQTIIPLVTIYFIYFQINIALSQTGIDPNIALLSSGGNSSPITNGTLGGVGGILGYIQSLAQPLGFLGVALGSIVTYVLTPVKKIVTGTVKKITTLFIKVKNLGLKGYLMELQRQHLGFDLSTISEIVDMKDRKNKSPTIKIDIDSTPEPKPDILPKAQSF